MRLGWCIVCSGSLWRVRRVRRVLSLAVSDSSCLVAKAISDCSVAATERNVMRWHFLKMTL